MSVLKTNIGLYIMGGLAAALLVTLGVVYWLWGERDDLVEQKGALTLALDTQKGATDAAVKNAEAWRVSAEGFKTALDDMAKADTEATKQLRRLNDVLAKHDLGELARKKPGLIERRANAASDAARLRLEQASGGLGAVGAGAAAAPVAAAP